MDNLTEIQDNPFKDTDLEDNTSQTISLSSNWTVRDYISISMHLLKFFLCLMNISASIFLMVIIMRFRKLRTRVNIYFFHCALNNVMYYLSEPILLILFSLLEVGYNETLFCCLHEFDDSCLILLFVFAIFAVLDYYSFCLSSRLLFLYKNMYKYFIFILYNIGVIKFLISIIICFSDKIHLKHHVLTITFLIVFTTICLFNFIEYRERKKANKQERIRYALIVANVIVFCWLPLFVYDVLEGYYLFEVTSVWDDEPTALRAFLITNHIPEFLAHGHGIIVVYMLGRLDKNFKMAYTIALKRRFRNYEHNDLDQSEDESTVHHQVNGYNKTTNENDETVNTEEAYSDIALR